MRPGSHALWPTLVAPDSASADLTRPLSYVPVHERADRRAAEADDEVSLPMARHRPIGRLGRAFADHDLGRDEAFASPARARSRDPQCSTAAQAGGQLALQTAAALDE